ncbi:AbrB/MazE/SpoVT family DNA-binding domain-containing protein [Noviherbaspirillum sp. CPCC 100848]|uniref:AbrB/MazE/SpoVT family DNA-binding domain-containing protein n=1 Tax=Noviherbaspirillum album TaxID=3080276 RepID=A0ABU6J8G8_9BURK|nr:AbrB/MazE/SpoVT family DNA-binding domain-containing protein [Noviherbaspirillum sp. CPCC 100848]MEC4719635.1 AbrB/MazE/SpoVT family DNA-binding domain-containing protein [Noviherbaspirillum sp. CPCC 100848]
MKTAIRKMGNSQGILIPKPFLLQTGLDIGEVDIDVENDTIVIRKPKKKAREGWAEACQKIAASAAEQAIAWPLITNDADAGFSW